MNRRPDIARRWLRFAVGLIVVVTVAAFFMTGHTPPGFAGEVLGNNRRMDIDASPLFYSEVEHMADLEAGVRRMQQPSHKSRTLFSRPLCEDVLR